MDGYQVENVHELPKEICTKKCEALRKELQEARAQLEKLQISCDHSLAIPGTTARTHLKIFDRLFARTAVRH